MRFNTGSIYKHIPYIENLVGAYCILNKTSEHLNKYYATFLSTFLNIQTQDDIFFNQYKIQIREL